MEIKTQYNVGDVVAYADRTLSRTPRFAQILSIKIDEADIEYEMSDAPIPTNKSGPQRESSMHYSYWVKQTDVIRKYSPYIGSLDDLRKMAP